MISQTGAPPERSRSPPPNIPPQRPMRISSAATIAKKLEIVMIATSRFAMCESSWATTPSTSARSSRRHRPSVTATTECLGFRPVAKAFGTSVGITATRGFGRSAIAHSRSTMSCSSGAWSRSTICARDAASAILSDVKYCRKASPPMIRSTIPIPTSRIWSRITKKATYSAPSRNMVVTMRTDSPKSRPYALRFMPKILALSLLVAAVLPASAGAAPARFLVVVDPELEFSDLGALSKQGAVGLLVPDAGPETSEARARAAVASGKVRNSLLGDKPPGPALISLLDAAQTRPALPVIAVGLPHGGTQPNDRRYPIFVQGPRHRGLLTSSSTRIPGLVSVVDVAPTALGREGKLGSTQDDDPPGALRELDRRIREHRDAKTPFLLVSFALIVGLALFRRAAVIPAFAAVLLANLFLGITGWTNVWVDLFVVLAFAGASIALARFRPVVHGVLLAGVLGAYLVAMWIDAAWVALSPLGPTQNARFYGLSNLLSTLLLVPALASAAILGGWAAAAAVLVALVAALALGGGSHVTTAIAGGPAELAEDFWRRLNLSWLRATSGWGVALLVFGGIAALILLALRERRRLLLAYLAALAVSLLVNDSPNDVIVAGLAGYLVLSTAPGVARRAAERATPAAPEPRARSAPAATQ